MQSDMSGNRMFSMFLTSKVGRLLAGLLTAVAVLFGTIQYGRKAQREADRVDELEDYIDTKKEIDDVEASTDPDAAFKRLRNNGWLR